MAVRRAVASATATGDPVYHFRAAGQRLSTGLVVSAVMLTTAQW
jgi:hypothetical protein